MTSRRSFRFRLGSVGGQLRLLARASGRATSSLAASVIAGAEPKLSLGAQAAKLPPGQEFLLATTSAVREQGDEQTCCAHAVAAAMETRLVDSHGANPLALSIDPMAIFTPRPKRSLGIACEVAAGGVPDSGGVTHAATTNFLGGATIEEMIVALKEKRTPLMIELQVQGDFLNNDDPFLYRPNAPDAGAHAVCVVGYGTDAASNDPYWVIKNSFGPQWRRHGYAGILWNDPIVVPERTVHVMVEVT